MEAVVSRELAIKVVLHGACRIPEVGKSFSEFSTSDLIWAEDKKIAAIPLWVLSGYGDGYGDGSGYGYGYGDGSGYGDGYGYGSGYGDGFGSGDGSGDGSGSGYGSGDGSGSGYGSGSGSGYGDGSGDGSKGIYSSKEFIDLVTN